MDKIEIKLDIVKDLLAGCERIADKQGISFEFELSKNKKFTYSFGWSEGSYWMSSNDCVW